jgi:hypothetical protein
MMPGTLMFSHMKLGKETTAGTSVAATRLFYPDGTGLLQIDRQRTFHEGANRGTSVKVTHATQMGISVEIPFRTAGDVGVAYDELPYYFAALDGGKTGSGAGNDKTWTFAPTLTTQETADTFTVEVGDATQNFDVEYCVARRIALSASRDGLTQGEIDFFGRQATKATTTAVTANNAVKIPGYLWTIKFATAQSGLAGASTVGNFLRSWSLDLDTGQRPHFYLDGNAYFGQTVQSQPVVGTLELVVDSTSQAITQFYDKAVADTVDFIQLAATGPTLGGSNYAATIQMAVLYDDPEVIGSENEGVNQYSITAHLAYDSTWAQAITGTFVNSVATL